MSHNILSEAIVLTQQGSRRKSFSGKQLFLFYSSSFFNHFEPLLERIKIHGLNLRDQTANNICIESRGHPLL